MATRRPVATTRPTRPLSPIPLTALDVAVGRVAHHQAAFEGRWTRKQLARVAPLLAARLEHAIKTWHQAIERADDAFLPKAADAMIRGWLAASATMDEAHAFEGSYQVGMAKDGCAVVISDRPAAQVHAWAKELGRPVAWITPDDVADLLTSLGHVAVAALSEFPGARIVRVGPESQHEPYEEFYAPGAEYIGDPTNPKWVGSTIEDDDERERIKAEARRRPGQEPQLVVVPEASEPVSAVADEPEAEEGAGGDE